MLAEVEIWSIKEFLIFLPIIRTGDSRKCFGRALRLRHHPVIPKPAMHICEIALPRYQPFIVRFLPTLYGGVRATGPLSNPVLPQ